MNTLSLRQTATLVAVFVIASVGLVLLDRGDALEPAREGLSSVLTPVSRGFAAIARGPGHEGDVETRLREAEAERDAALAENANLYARLAESGLAEEEARMEASRPELSYVATRVLGRDPTNAQQFIVIDQGTDDGVEIGMAVTDPDFFVGQVVEVQAETAKVMLITDTSASVGAQIMESRADGIVTGQWQTGGRLLMEHVAAEPPPAEGDYVVTSQSNITGTRGVPPDLLIGAVVGDPQPGDRTDDVALVVQPGADFDELDTVWVVMPNDA